MKKLYDFINDRLMLVRLDADTLNIAPADSAAFSTLFNEGSLSGKFNRFSIIDDQVITVEAGNSVPINGEVFLKKNGAGTATLLAGADVTLNGSLVCDDYMLVKKISSSVDGDVYDVMGGS